VALASPIFMMPFPGLTFYINLDRKGSQVLGSTFKVGDKDRMDDPKTCRSRLSSLKEVPNETLNHAEGG
jgi:hypothetical protein